MYTKQQASLIRQSFWTAFGRYLAPVPNAEGNKINWINYKTGIRHIYFRMDANRSEASINIILSNNDITRQQQDYAQLLELKPMLEAAVGEVWNWQQGIVDEHGKTISIIGKSITGVNIFSEESWPVIISFLKPRIMALDAFWYTAKDLFE